MLLTIFLIILGFIGLFAVTFVVGFVISIIYLGPYYWHLAGENLAGRDKDKQNVSYSQHMKNATKLYKSWFRKKSA